MEKTAIYHKGVSNYAYAYDKETLHIRLRTKKEDVLTVAMIYGDPYDFEHSTGGGNLAEARYDWQVERIDLKKIGYNEWFDFWQVAVKPEFKRHKYGFLLSDEEETIFYGENAIFQVEKDCDAKLYDQKNFFTFPYLNGVDVFKSPSWVKDRIWYQIFPERFYRDEDVFSKRKLKKWGAPIKRHDDFYGGNLKGIINQIDYLEALGINGLYLTPVFKSKSTHKYDTIDYFQIDEDFGTKEDLKKLVSECHKRDIRVILDGVFNHCGFDHPMFQDVLKNQEASLYKDYFHIRTFPIEIQSFYEKNQLYSAFGFGYSMPKWNTENEDVKKMMIEIGQYWIEECDIDGWRLDVANEVDHDFWRAFRKAIKVTKPEAYILGEIWHDSMPWLLGDQFDGVMNYPFFNAINQFFTSDTSTSQEFLFNLNTAMMMYPENVNESLYNLLGSHDTNRVLTRFNNNRHLVKMAYAFALTFVGQPAIYYGDEVGIEGGDDPDCRRCMIWDEKYQDIEMLDFMKKMIDIRKSNNALSGQGHFEFVQISDNSKFLIYKRSHDEDLIYIIMNPENQKLEVQLPNELQHKHFKDLLNNQSIKYDAKVQFEAYEVKILTEIR